MAIFFTREILARIALNEFDDGMNFSCLRMRLRIYVVLSLFLSLTLQNICGAKYIQIKIKFYEFNKNKLVLVH